MGKVGFRKKSFCVCSILMYAEQRCRQIDFDSLMYFSACSPWSTTHIPSLSLSHAKKNPLSYEKVVADNAGQSL